MTALYKDMDGNHYGSYSITIIIRGITTTILDVGNLLFLPFWTSVTVLYEDMDGNDIARDNCNIYEWKQSDFCCTE